MKKLLMFFAIFSMIFFLNSRILQAMDNNMEIGGFISQGFLQSDKNNYLAESSDGSFQFNEMGIYFSSTLSPNLRVGLQLFARDLGEVGNDEISANWAFAEYKWFEWLGLRAGLVKFPQGLYNDSRDMDMLRTFVFLPSGVYNEYFRDGVDSQKGLQVFGNLLLGKMGVLEYGLQAGGVGIPIDSGTSKFYKEVTGQLNDVTKITVGTVFGAHLDWSLPVDGLRVKAFYATTDYEMEGTTEILNTTIPIVVDASKSEWITVSVAYLIGDFLMAAEYYTNINKSAVFTPDRSTKLIPSDTTTSVGYYASVSYRVNSWLELGTYFTSYENDDDLKPTDALEDAQNELKEIVLAVRFDINSNWIAKLECHKVDGLFGVEKDGDKDLDEDWFLYTAKLTYFF